MHNATKELLTFLGKALISSQHRTTASYKEYIGWPQKLAHKDAVWWHRNEEEVIYTAYEISATSEMSSYSHVFPALSMW